MKLKFKFRENTSKISKSKEGTHIEKGSTEFQVREIKRLHASRIIHRGSSSQEERSHEIALNVSFFRFYSSEKGIIMEQYSRELKSVLVEQVICVTNACYSNF